MIFTIGHSTRSADEFVALLSAHGITAVADVRTISRSRRHPHFSAESLAALLSTRDIAYVHLPGLGGLRKPRPDSTNAGWRNEGFRGYADYMQTPDFKDGIGKLIALATDRRVAVMCAEAKWWQCHRQLIADALVARGIAVVHVMSGQEAVPHELTPFARVTGTTVRYPALL